MSDDLLKTGLTIRGDVIGHARSEAALAGATAFDRAFQELALRYCWGEIWGRPGLEAPGNPRGRRSGRPESPLPQRA